MDLLKTQKDQFNKISKTYESEGNLRVSRAIFNISVEKYFPRLRGSRVLDVGNGGLKPSTILGEEIAASLTSFVAVDKNEEMLHRTKKDDYVKIVADGANLPFEDKSFDYVLLNGVLHHQGLESNEDQYLKFERFFKELARVCSKEIIVLEIFLPEHLEKLERIAVKVLGSMPTFVLAESTLDAFLLKMGLRKREVISKRLSDFVGPFYWYLVILEYSWFKLPAFLSPFKYVYFTIPVQPNLK
ncbi:MAG: class I SAM-dependent methyltransferase [Patescibacteria group bacterium]